MNASIPNPGDGVPISFRRFIFFHLVGDHPLEWRTQLRSTCVWALRFVDISVSRSAHTFSTLIRDETGSLAASLPFSALAAAWCKPGPLRTGIGSSPMTCTKISSFVAINPLHPTTFIHFPSSWTAVWVLNSPIFDLVLIPSWASVLFFGRFIDDGQTRSNKVCVTNPKNLAGTS